MSESKEPQNSRNPVPVDSVRRAVRQKLASLHAAGLEILPVSTGRWKIPGLVVASGESAVPATPSPPASQRSDDRNRGPAGPASAHQAGSRKPATRSRLPLVPIDEPYGPSLDRDARTGRLEQLAETVSRCTRCEELSRCRTQTVFGVGNAAPRLCFLGEGPGADEDRLGEPFVGAAGQLLNRIMEASKMKRDEVYILNTVKCRPPANRNPTDAEVANCWEYAERQLDILQPEFICCLGSVAARTLLRTKLSIGRLRQKFHKYRGSRVIVTYHPAYLLRQPSAKRAVWDDMKMLMGAMGIEP